MVLFGSLSCIHRLVIGGKSEQKPPTPEPEQEPEPPAPTPKGGKKGKKAAPTPKGKKESRTPAPKKGKGNQLCGLIRVYSDDA